MTDDRRTGIDGDQITDGTINPVELNISNPLEIANNKFLGWNETEAKFEWVKNHIGSLYPISFIGQGTVSNRWLDVYSNGISSNSTIHVIPMKSKLYIATFSNSEANTDFKINIWKLSASENDVDNKVYISGSPLVENVRAGVYVGLDTDFNVNDKVAVFVETTSSKPKDAVIVLYFKILENTDQFAYTSNFSGNFGSGIRP